MIQWLIKKRYEADFVNLEPMRQLVEKEAETLGINENDVYNLILAVTELATNSIEHGYQGEEGWVQIEIGHNDSDLTIIVTDGAPKYDPTTVPSPNTNVSLEDRPLRGLGVYIVRKIMDEFTYKLDEDGNNQVTIVQYNSLGKVKEDGNGTDSN